MKRSLFAWCLLATACSTTPGPTPDASADVPVADSDDGASADAAPDATEMDAADGAVDPDASAGDASASETGADAAVPTAMLVERATITQRTDECIAPPTDFGTYGAVTQYDRYAVANSQWTGAGTLPSQVFVPVGGAATHPVLFYSHAFGGTDWTRVRSLLEMLVSNDYVVVFTPYPTSGATVCERYDILWRGHTGSVDAIASRVSLDTARMGFIGHSFGAGATPWLATEAARARGWAREGVFLMPNAPWYSFRMSAAQWSALPTNARMHVMVFDDDTTNDHRIAIEDQWTPFPRAKQWVSLVSATNGSCTMTADHIVPATDSTLMDSVRLNALDRWGVWRHAHALAECTLRGRAAACAVIDGSSVSNETAMGVWRSDGTAVPTARQSTMPEAPRPSAEYMFPVTRRALYPCDGRGT